LINRNKDRKTPFTREVDDELEAMRDDCIALFLNSRMTQKAVHAAGGPTPGTISKWLYKETLFPRFTTIRDFVKALGCKIVIVDKSTKINQAMKGKAAHPKAKRPIMPLKKSKS
jgi:hypothetical protein